MPSRGTARGTASRAALRGHREQRRGEVGVGEQHVEPAAVGDRTVQIAQRRGGTARGRYVHVLFRGERGRQGFGEDAVVVDHQNPDALHRDPLSR